VEGGYGMIDLLAEIGIVNEPRRFGSLELGEISRKGFSRPAWVFRPHPAAAIRLKHTFPRIEKGVVGVLKISKTDETSRDVEWFLERFPMEMADDVKRELFLCARRYDAKVAQVHAIATQQTFSRSLNLAFPLRTYQKQAVEMTIATSGLLLGDDLGLGKTVSAIGVMAALDSVNAELRDAAK
jgi:hypothetical protein